MEMAAMQSRHGFTLLELLLAMTILGTVVLVALGAFRIGQRSWEKGDAVAENNQRLRVAVERMRQQLSAATVYLGPEEEGGAIGFMGEARTLRFVSRISLIPNREQGLVLVHYRILGTDGRQQTLAFSEQPVLTLGSIPADEPDADTYHPLLTGLADAAWQYRGSDDGRGAPWRESWDAGDALALPAGVRLQLRRGQEAPLAVVIRIVNPAGE
jgi:general secretion pathway protein J